MRREVCRALSFVRAIAILGAIAAIVATPAPAADASSFLDKPAKIVRVPLPRDPDNPQARPELSCTYYQRFAVKQIDLGELGADQLSILADGTPCRKESVANEKIVSAKDWTGYFEGVKGNYIFFTAEDGWNDGLGFAVFTADARKLFEDVAKKWTGVELRPSGMLLRYERVYEAPCSLQADAAACWRTIMKATGLIGASPPNCKAAYVREQKRVPKFAKQALSDPTVIDYVVSTTIDARTQKITPATGEALRCRPAD